MSLNKISLTTVVKNQFQYKLKIYTSVFTSLVILQVLALLFSTMGSGGGSGVTSYGTIETHFTHYSIHNTITFTFIWAFIHAIMMTTKTDWEKSFPFVGNRFSHDLSNIVFLFFASTIGGILTVLSTFALRVITFYFNEKEMLIANNFLVTGGEIISGLLSMIFHLFLFCAIGYFLGTVTRLHRLLPVLLPVIIVGIIIALIQANSDFLLYYIEFYFEEPNPLLFIIKIIVSAIVLFTASMFVSSRTEVRK